MQRVVIRQDGGEIDAAAISAAARRDLGAC
jgi:hypothetical protein